MECALILLALTVVIMLIEWKSGQRQVWYDVILMTIQGLAGCVLFVMLFSQHPTVRINLQLLFFNPLHLVYLWPIIKGRSTRYWHLCAVLCVLFLIGSQFQTYAEGIYFLALCLLLQSTLHIFLHKKNEQ